MIIFSVAVLAIRFPAKDPIVTFRIPLFPESNPINVLEVPDVNPYPARAPMVVFCDPDVIPFPAETPIIVLSDDEIIMEFPERLPTTVLRIPFRPAPYPTKVLRVPVDRPYPELPPRRVFLDPVVTVAPASAPIIVFSSAVVIKLAA